jgi:hypothetical protein
MWIWNLLSLQGKNIKFKVTRIIYGAKACSNILHVTGGLRDSLIDELHNLYASQNVMKVIKSGTGHVERMTEMETHNKYRLHNLRLHKYHSYRWMGKY